MAPTNAPEKDHVYVSLLKCVKTIDVDWKKFAAEIDIKATGNAQRKLKEHLKKDGLNLIAGNPSNIVPFVVGETNLKKLKTELKDTKVDTNADIKTETKKTAKSGGKRKAKEEEADEEVEESPTKKSKVKDVLEESDKDEE